jgi:hypothetical protein
VSDLPLLRAVGRPVAVNPESELRAVAEAEGWPILETSRWRGASLRTVATWRGWLRTARGRLGRPAAAADDVTADAPPASVGAAGG